MDIQTFMTSDGRTLQSYDTDPTGQSQLTVFWHHGTPNIGAPPEPLFTRSAHLGIRWISCDRPGYGGSARMPGRDVAHIAQDVAFITQRLSIERFAVMGHSGGGPHALACAALLPDQVLAAVSVAGLAPFGVGDLQYFDGMYPGGRAELQAATQGASALARVLEVDEFDPQMFTSQDHDALQGPWTWLNTVVGPALEHGPGGMIDDDLAYVHPWGFTPEHIRVPLLLHHGMSDQIVPVSHALWLKKHVPHAALFTSPDDGHISILNQSVMALDWLSQQQGEQR